MSEILTLVKDKFTISRQSEKAAFCFCPFHKKGGERTGSLYVNLTGKYRGRFICFACGKKGSVLNGSTVYDADNVFELDYAPLEDSEHTELEINFNRLPIWKDDWRTIPNWLLKRLSAREDVEKYTKVVLPCYQLGSLVGIINCSLEKSKFFPSYIYSSGGWITSTWFPYDYTHNHMVKNKLDTLFLVEGPRDALKLLSYGIPALANLGGITVYSQAKVELLEDFPAKQIVLAFDNDKIGRKLYKKYKKSLPMIKTGRLNMDTDDGSKLDPASLPRQRLKLLQATFGMVES